MLNLFKEFNETAGGLIESSIMSLPVKFRDQLCFKGQKVDYDNLTKFVLRKGKYLPLLCTPKQEEDDVIIDMYPLICVGMAEILAISAQVGDTTIRKFEAALYTDDILFSDIERYSRFNKFLSVSEDCFKTNKDEISIILSLRTDYANCCFESIRRITAMMIACKHSNPKLFCEFILESMKFAYSNCSLFTTPLEKLAGIKGSSTNDLERYSLKDVVTLSSISPKRIGYTVPNTKSKKYISSCRGLGIYAYLILFFSIYEKFGVVNSSYTIDIGICDDSYKELLQKKFIDCLGDDYVGRYYRNGKTKFREYDSDTVSSLDYSGNIGGSSSIPYKLSDGRLISRDAYENDLLFRRANRVTYNKVTDGLFLRNTNIYYVDIFLLDGLYHSVVKFSAIKSDAFTNIVDKFKLHERETMITKEQFDNEMDKLCTRYNNMLQNVQESNKKLTEDYEAKIKEYERIIASKSNIIDNLTENLRDANVQLQSYYSDDCCEEVVEPTISLQEALNYINQFAVVLVGGRNDILPKLEEIGWLNVRQISDQNILNSTPIKADFFCMNTKFISHKIVRSVESKYQDQKSQMYYYNGTNVENLVFCTYEFIRKWVEE